MPAPRIDDLEADFWTRQIRLGAVIATVVTLLGVAEVLVNWAPGQRWWAVPMAAAAGTQALVGALPWRRWIHHRRVRLWLVLWWVLEIPVLVAFALNDPTGLVLYLPCAMLIVVMAAALYSATVVVGLGTLVLAGFLMLLTDATTVLVVGMTAVLVSVVTVSAIMAHNRRRLDNRRRAAERRTEALLQNSPEMVICLGRDGDVRYASPSMQTVLGHPAAAVNGAMLGALVHPRDLDRIRDWITALRSSAPATTAEAEARLRRADGSWVVVDIIGTNCLYDADLQALVISMRDIATRKALEEQLSRQAFTDPLTGLSNRALFGDRLQHATARRGAQVTVVLVDLDNFKDVNDNLGHSAGDDLLTTIAGRLRDTVGPADTLARLGGDEFAVLIEDLDGRDPGTFAEQLLQQIRRTIRLASRDLHCTASIGVAAGDAGDLTGEELLRNADLAMYAAKRQGRNAYALFEPAMYASVIHEAQQRLEIEHALAGEQFVVHYQPVVDLRTERLIGVEALVRWQHPVRGLLGPQEFIDNTEASGLIVPLGRWVLQQACRQLARWQQMPGWHQLTMNVNLSARQFQYPGLVADVREVIEEAGIEARCLTLELTESILLEDVDAAVETLRTLRELGVHLAIDDFGTGYSSLNYLKLLPVDILKIDRAFISHVATDADDRALVDAVVTMARALRLRTVAEGIETDDQREMLRRLGCDHGQGFLFGRPVEPASIVATLVDPASTAPEPSAA
ncbi:putative bifunctional diguanylate cyclase/phosphodiesterase [Actinoplanes sp. NPDC020271]|uniref:putative bifunctional diguanylate cyclase/phosphodiesterase n=1 Tax=Actinoplanes sp. NPDC020271 TaxID=3363896 RepID=UPI00379D6316